MADEELTQRVNSTSPAPSPADEDKTQVVPRMTPTDAAAPIDSEAEEKTSLIASQPPPAPQPATAPPPASAGQQHRTAPPQQPYGPPPSAPPPPHGGPGRGVPPPPPGYGPQFPPPPGYGAQFAPPSPQQGYAAGGPTPPANGYSPNATQNPMDAANALLAKGNSLISKLMYRGIRGELIRQPWFVNFRQQSPDQFVYITYGIGLFLALVMSLLPGFIGTLITDVIFAGLIYLYFALGTKLAHQFVVYGICGAGAVLAFLRALYNVATFFDLASVHLAGYALGVLISAAITVVSGLVLAYIGFQVYRGVQRLSSQ